MFERFGVNGVLVLDHVDIFIGEDSLKRVLIFCQRFHQILKL